MEKGQTKKRRETQWGIFFVGLLVGVGGGGGFLGAARERERVRERKLEEKRDKPTGRFHTNQLAIDAPTDRGSL